DGTGGEGGVCRTGQAGDDREAGQGDFDADILEDMQARAPDHQFGQAQETKTHPPQELWRASGYTEAKITHHNSRRERERSRTLMAECQSSLEMSPSLAL